MILLFLSVTLVCASESTSEIKEEKTILFGQSAALNGPAAALGQGMAQGVIAAFKEINKQGGIRGHTLQLISKDDGYEPELAIENTLEFIKQDKVFALIASVGTPTSTVTAPIASAAGVPFIAPYTGAAQLRSSSPGTVINLRASYHQEAEFIVKWLTETRNVRRIAVLYQDDSFGRSGLTGVRNALARRNLEVTSTGSYERNTIAIKRALYDIHKSKPDAVIIVGAYKPSAEFALWATKLQLKLILVNLSFVGSNALAAQLGNQKNRLNDIFVSQVVPPPESNMFKLLSEYRLAMSNAGFEQSTGYVSLEGYLAGRLAIAALHSIDGPITRKEFLTTFKRQKEFDLGGIRLQYGEGDNQGLDTIYLTRINRDGSVEPIAETQQ